MRRSIVWLTRHDIVSQNCSVTHFAAPEARGAQFVRGSLCSPERRAAVAAGLSLAVAFLYSTLTRADAPPALRAVQGEKPPFNLTDIAGGETSLAAFAGRPVLVHFFATWCEPCREEIPALRRLVARAGNENLAVLAISVAEVPIRVRRFVSETPVNFPVLLDQDRTIAKAWGVDSLPTSFILDAALKPRLAAEREFDWDRFDLNTLKHWEK